MDSPKPLPTFLHNSLLWESMRENNDGHEPTYADFDIEDLRNKGLFKDDDLIMEMHDFAWLLQTCEYWSTTDYPKTFYNYALQNKDTVLDFLEKKIAEMPESNRAKLVEFRDGLEKTSLHYELHYLFQVRPEIYNNERRQQFEYQLILLFVCDNIIARTVLFGIKGKILINIASARVDYVAKPCESCTIDLLVDAIENNGKHENFDMFYENNCLRIGYECGETRFYVTKFNRDAVLHMFRKIQQVMMNLPKYQICPYAENIASNVNILKHAKYILENYEIINFGSTHKNNVICIADYTSYKKFKFANKTALLNKIDNALAIPNLTHEQFVELGKEFVNFTRIRISESFIDDGEELWYCMNELYDDNYYR